MTDAPYEKAILEHYRKQALEFGLDPASTMLDQTTREMEVTTLVSSLTCLQDSSVEHVRLLEVGCGNGFLLQAIRTRLPKFQLTGVDYSPPMVKLAQQRALENCGVLEGDVRSLPFATGRFDFVVAERCLINLLDRALQDRALTELWRLLRPGGHLLLIEAFTDGLANLNRARAELGLPENHMPEHNLWFDKQHMASVLEPLFEQLNSSEAGDTGLAPANFLSTHYFVSRVLYAALTSREILYNTEFVRFFKFLPPMGNYSPIQFFCLRKKG